MPAVYRQLWHQKLIHNLLLEKIELICLWWDHGWGSEEAGQSEEENHNVLKSQGGSSALPVSLSFCWQLPVHLPDWKHEAFVRGSPWFTVIMLQKRERISRSLCAIMPSSALPWRVVKLCRRYRHDTTRATKKEERKKTNLPSLELWALKHRNSE